MKINPLFLIDFYKATHAEQYPKGARRIVSYYTPRLGRLPNTDGKVVMFGLQYFIKEYLIDGFNDNFFNRPIEEVINEYKRIMDATLGKGSYGLQKIIDLHKLGFLPIEICAVPEGMRTAIGVPQIEITNTAEDFAWLVNTIETMLSCTMWHTQVSAEVGYRYWQIVEYFWRKTCEESVNPRRLLGDFSMRGQHSIESAMKSSAGWCLSFLNTATVPAILWLENYYNCDCTKEDVAYGAISTEHSVMCSNYAVDGDEITHVKRLLTEIYPNHSFSMVSDSYDYWNLVNNILPQCKEEIMNHNGTISIRGDSGDPVQVVTETVFRLWDIFGGTINKKGYKVLDSHVKAIYGDSITPQRCHDIYKILKDNGFSIQNVSLGVGSYSMMCLSENIGNSKIHHPYTRDTYGIAVKATYMEDENSNPVMVYKQPKETSWKKSQKGCCLVDEDGMGYQDGFTYDEVVAATCTGDGGAMQLVFSDSTLLVEFSLENVRQNMYGEINDGN